MTTATMNGIGVTSAHVNLPEWGCWYADAALDGEHAITGAAALKVADLSLSGTVLSGGPAKGRSDYRIVGGKGGWGKILPRKPYATDIGVKWATVIGDAAREAGEVIGPIDPSLVTGPAFVRPKGPASSVLNRLAPRGWYVGEDGVTRLGKRPAGTLPGHVTRITPADLARRTITLASESIAAIVPGVVVDGLVAVDVLHTIDAKKGLRSQVWGSLAGGSSRDLDAFRKLFEQLFPNFPFMGLTEYRVVTKNGKRLDLQAVRVSTGMPDIGHVSVMPGVAGCDSTDVALGSRVLVGFVDSDQGRPVVLAFEDAEGASFVPTTLSLLGGTSGIARLGDEVTISVTQFGAALPANGGGAVATTQPMKGTISSASSKAKCG